MAQQDSEKRFHSIMDKLFYAPKSIKNSSSSYSVSGVQVSSGRKRPNPSASLTLINPKARCVDKAQHFASTKKSEAPLCRPWDRGDLLKRLATIYHFFNIIKLLLLHLVSAVNCARRGWVNVEMDIIACEACGARLLFSTPSSWTQQQGEKAALVFSLKLDNGHKLHCPWIDNACDESLAQFPPTTPQVLIDEFRGRLSSLLQLLALPLISSSALAYMGNPELEDFLRQASVLEYENSSVNVFRIDSLDDESAADAAKLYFQALKLISLCGWEPRPLPYMVDCKDREKRSIKEADILKLSYVVDEVQSGSANSHAAVGDETVDASGDFDSLFGQQTDPSSVVLDCRLCGASAGLWTFSTVPRPLESFRVVGFTEVNRDKNSESNDKDNEIHVNTGIGVINTAPSMNLTIAGGPPPTKQNFKATISMPVIGRNLRSRFSNDSNFRDGVHANSQSAPRNDYSLQVENEQAECSFSGGLLNSERHEGQYCHLTTDHSLSLNHETFENGHASLPETGSHDSVTHKLVPSFDQSHRSPQSTRNTKDIHLAVEDDTLQVSRTDVLRSTIVSAVGHLESSPTISSLKVNGDTAHSPVSTEGMIPKQHQSDESMEFDPIRQHRHFCPWIASTGNAAPGWQQVLSAVQRHKDASHSSPATCSSPSFIKFDDPITSIRRLFESPASKKRKSSH